LQAMQRSSPVGYRRRACSPRNRGEMGPCCREKRLATSTSSTTTSLEEHVACEPSRMDSR
jgi:hypothetical protein